MLEILFAQLVQKQLLKGLAGILVEEVTGLGFGLLQVVVQVVQVLLLAVPQNLLVFVVQVFARRGENLAAGVSQSELR